MEKKLLISDLELKKAKKVGKLEVEHG